MKDDLVWDMVDALTSVCARLFGRRSAANRARKAVEAIRKGWAALDEGTFSA